MPALQLLANRDFRKVWFAGALVGTMRWLDTLAVGVYVLNETGSAFTVALILFLRTAPMFLFGVLAGAITEKIDRRVLLLSILGILAVANVTLVALTLTGRLEIWHLGVGVFLLGVYFSLELPTRRTMVADIAGLSRIAAAMGLESTTIHFTRMAGPFAGGILFEIFNIAGTQMLGGALYATAFVLIATAAYTKREAPAEQRSISRDIADGLKFVAHHRAVLATLLITVILNLFAFSYISMVPVIGKQIMGLSAFPIGLLMSAEGLGAVMGAMSVAFLAVPKRFNQIYFAGAFVFMCCIVLFSLVGDFALALPILIVGGFGMAGFGALQSTLIVANTPPELRNRVMGTLTMAIGAQPIGILVVGFLAERFGPDVGVTVSAGTGVVACLAAALIWPEMTRKRDATDA